MNTTIIECIKKKSAIQGKSRWTTDVAGDGLILEAGDAIEIEGCAINSKGIGADVIEISKDPVENIYHNKGWIDFNYYIMNDGAFTVPLPVNNQFTWGYEVAAQLGTGIYDRRYGQIQDPNLITWTNGGGSSVGHALFQDGGAWTPIHRANSSSSATDGTTFGENVANCDWDSFGFKRTLPTSALQGGAFLDGKRYYILEPTQAGGAFTDCPYVMVTYRAKVNINSGYVYPASIADEVTTCLHETWDAGEEKLDTNYYQYVAPFGGTGGGDPVAAGTYSRLANGGIYMPTSSANTPVYQIAEQRVDKDDTNATSPAPILPMKNFNGVANIARRANPDNFYFGAAGGGWSCETVAARNPYRIIAGTNLLSIPTKIGTFDGLPMTAPSAPISSSHVVSVNLAGANSFVANTSAFGFAVAADHFKDCLLYPLTNTHTQAASLVILASTAGGGVGGNNITITIRNSYLPAATKTTFQNDIASNGCVIVAKKENALVNITPILASTPLAEGYVIISNLPFTQSAGDLEIQDSIITGTHKDKLVNYFNKGCKYNHLGTNEKSPLPTTEAAILADAENWECEWDCGRGKSGEVTVSAQNLPPYWITNATTPTSTTVTKQQTLGVYGKWSQRIYDMAFLSPADILAGWYIDRTPQKEHEIFYDPAEFCMTNNLMFVVVKNRNLPNFQQNGVIGFILRTKLADAVDVPARNYAGFNPSFTYTKADNTGNNCAVLRNGSRTQFGDIYIDGANGLSTANPVRQARWNYFRNTKGGINGRTGDGGTPIVYGDALKFDFPKTAWTNYVNIGSPNVYLNFNDVEKRFEFLQLHNACKVTNQFASGTPAAPQPVPDAGTPVIRVNPQVDYGVYPADFTAGDKLQINSTYTAQSGLGIAAMGGFTDKIDGSTDGAGQYILNADNWSGSFWERLGFEYYDLISLHGLGDTTNIFNPSNQHQYGTAAIQNAHQYPKTTDSVLATPTAIVMSIGGGPDKDLGLPMYDLGFQQGFAAQPSATSAALRASALPKKLTYPYWLLYSNIVGGLDFYSGNNKSNCLGIITRNYTSGDFAYAFNFNRQFVIQNPTVLTSITQEILNPDFTPADIDDYSVILYKIEKRNGQPQLQQQKKTPRN
tara:strand:- start:12462 stop:15812 length:3351 start_codon:yes stop_codon:yes gene_type:complete